MTRMHAGREMSGQAERVKLLALLDGQRIGNIYQTVSGTYRFVYEDSWRADPSACPLSLSMPLTARKHEHQAIVAFLWGLLPDNDRTLDRYGRLFGVSSGNPVALLAHIGADCAGAVQLAPPETVDALVGRASPTGSDVVWLTHREVAAELRSVREDGIPGRTSGTAGWFSLAGAQPKIALVERNQRWGRPAGRTPTNRILKPPSRDFPGFAENEHLCLELARELDLGAVTSRVLRFDDEVTIAVDRFDRIERDGRNYRIHQEDICQAFAILPTRKYESDGGPGISDIISLLREVSNAPAEDISRFIGAVILNWIVVATDAHAKNYALLHGSGGGVRLAPFYDIASYLPYTEPGLHRVKLAMKIGGQYLARRITRGSWAALAKANGLPASNVLDRAEQILTELPGAIEIVRDNSIREGLEPTVIDGLSARLRLRVDACREAMQSTTRKPSPPA